MTKHDLAVSVAARTGLSLADASFAVSVFLDEIRAEYGKGNRVELRGFGTFFPYLRKVRKYKDPATGEIKLMMAGHQLKFRSSPQLFVEG